MGLRHFDEDWADWLFFSGCDTLLLYVVRCLMFDVEK